MDLSNKINLGILIATGVVGVASCWIAMVAAMRANRAADRSATAAEASVRLQQESLDFEHQRHSDAAKDATRARLRIELVQAQVIRNGGPRTEELLTISNTSTTAAARNIRIFVDGQTLDSIPECRTPFTIGSTIPPEGFVKLLFKRVGGGGLKNTFEVKIDWDDDSGTDRSLEQAIAW